MHPFTSAAISSSVSGWDDEGIFGRQFGGIGHMQRNAGEAVEAMLSCAYGATALSAPCCAGWPFLEVTLERIDRISGGIDQFQYQGVALPPLVDRPKRYRRAPISLQSGARRWRSQIGVAPHHPDVARHLIEHARRAVAVTRSTCNIKESSSFPDQTGG